MMRYYFQVILLISFLLCNYEHEFRYEQNVTTQTQMNLGMMMGNVKISGSDSQKIIILQTVVLPENSKKIPHKGLLTTSPNAIDYIAPNGVTARMQQRFNIQLPRILALRINDFAGGELYISDVDGEVSVTSTGGDLEFVQLQGGLRVTISAGEIVMTDVSGNIFCIMDGGTINGSNLTGDGQLHVNGGGIILDGFTGKLELQNDTGDIHLNRILGEYLKVSSGGGKIKLTNSAIDNSELITQGGTVRLVNLDGNCHVENRLGAITGKNLNGLYELLAFNGAITLDTVYGGLRLNIPVGEVSIKRFIPDIEYLRQSKILAGNGNVDVHYIGSKIGLDLISSHGRIRTNFRGDEVFTPGMFRYQPENEQHKIYIQTTSGDIHLTRGE